MTIVNSARCPHTKPANTVNYSTNSKPASLFVLEGAIAVGKSTILDMCAKDGTIHPEDIECYAPFLADLYDNGGNAALMNIRALVNNMAVAKEILRDGGKFDVVSNQFITS